MTGIIAHPLFKYAWISAALLVGLYAGLLGLLTTSFFQAHVVYLHKMQMTWFQDLDVPETFGFLRNQVTPFAIKSPLLLAERSMLGMFCPSSCIVSTRLP
jgi:abhydrolase domain-containing protein 12